MRLEPKKIIENANSILADGSNRQLMQMCFGEISQCEVYARPTLLQYYKSIGETRKPEEIGLGTREIKDAFSEKRIYFANGKLLTRIFGAENAPDKSLV